MPRHFCNGFYAGLLIAALAGIFLTTLWRSEQQVRLHNAHLLAQIEKKNWTAVAEFIAPDYHDRWGEDRALLLQRMRLVFRGLRNVEIEASNSELQVYDRAGSWRAKIVIKNAAGEFASLVEDRVNSLPAPFELAWRQQSNKPWDWKLESVENRALEIPAGGD